MNKSSIRLTLSLTYLGNGIWRLLTPHGNYWDLNKDLSNFKFALAGLVKKDINDAKKDINDLLQTLPGDHEQVEHLNSLSK